MTHLYIKLLHVIYIPNHAVMHAGEQPRVRANMQSYSKAQNSNPSSMSTEEKAKIFLVFLQQGYIIVLCLV